MNIKRPTVKTAVRFVLLAFVVASAGYLIARENIWSGGEQQTPSTPPLSAIDYTTPAVPDHVVAYYFHGNFRCASCKKIEEYSHDAIQVGFAKELKDGTLKFEVINVEESPNRHFINDYALATKSLVLVLKDGDRQVRFKNLDLVWQLLGSRDEFVAYVQNEVRGFLGEVKRFFARIFNGSFGTFDSRRMRFSEPSGKFSEFRMICANFLSTSSLIPLTLR